MGGGGGGGGVEKWRLKLTSVKVVVEVEAELCNMNCNICKFEILSSLSLIANFLKCLES